jgi:hypothetical protein
LFHMFSISAGSTSCTKASLTNVSFINLLGRGLTWLKSLGKDHGASATAKEQEQQVAGNATTDKKQINNACEVEPIALGELGQKLNQESKQRASGHVDHGYTRKQTATNIRSEIDTGGNADSDAVRNAEISAETNAVTNAATNTEANAETSPETTPETTANSIDDTSKRSQSDDTNRNAGKHPAYKAEWDRVESVVDGIDAVYDVEVTGGRGTVDGINRASAADEFNQIQDIEDDQANPQANPQENPQPPVSRIKHRPNEYTDIPVGHIPRTGQYSDGYEETPASSTRTRATTEIKTEAKIEKSTGLTKISGTRLSTKSTTSPVQEVIGGLSALQTGDLSLAHQQLGHALRSGEVDKAFLARVLIGSIDTHLGRAALFADRGDDAQRLLEEGVRLGVPGGASRSVDLMMAEAERCTRLGKDREAIQRWQDIASLLGENTPEHVYRQLSEAYARNQQSFGGTAEENRVWGDCHKHDVLEWFHKKLQPKLYLEIGVDEGLSLARATGPSIGIDPRPELKLKVDLPPQTRILPMSSDAFFRGQAVHMLHPKPGLVFIDGIHLFEFALRDFINVEKYAAPSTLVVIDDIYPTHPVQGSRRRKSGSWTGDIWKVHRILKEARPDLTLATLNSYTTGLLLICGLDPQNRTLEDEYQYWVDLYAKDELPPMNVISRNGAIPSGHPAVAELIDTLKQSEENAWSVQETRDVLSNLSAKIKATEEECWGRAESLSGFCDLENVSTTIG